MKKKVLLLQHAVLTSMYYNYQEELVFHLNIIFISKLKCNKNCQMFFNVCSPLPCNQGGFTEIILVTWKKLFHTPDNKKKGKSAGAIWKSLVTSGSSVESAVLIAREPTAKTTEIKSSHYR